MTVDDFAQFYQAIHGYPPFHWQEELMKRVAAQGWPNTIALPTSSGKTSAIDISVFHLALQAGRKGSERTAALRTFFVIDRRVVVDEASEHAWTIAEALRVAQNGILREAAQCLLTYKGELPLEVCTMRGGMYRDNSWADEPNQPLICVSTVDQTGSRLLFRGYQVGDSSRPVHAGLIGNDSLIIVDEAHLSKPFLDTLHAISRHPAAWGERPPAMPYRVVQMSATIDEPDTFRLDEANLASEPELAKRLQASKPAQLREPKKKFEEEMIAAAKELAAEPGVCVVGVIANTIASARAIFKGLHQQKGSDAVLLIGRNRPYCSQLLWEKYKTLIAAKPCREQRELLFVVATQTVEVGANIDFDALVTESAPMNALRQRFGRLNRLGNRAVSKAAIVWRGKDDVVYGEPTQNTWRFLKEREPIDFGVTAMNELLKDRPAGLDSVVNDGPILFPSHLEFWAQTNPTPSPDPDVAPFLHGASALDAADVQVVWREDLDPENDIGWRHAVEVAPPIATEALALPIAAVKRWLRNQDQEIADIEGIAIEASSKKPGERRRVLRWRGAGSPESKVVFDDAIRPGDTIIVPTSYRGADEFGWNSDYQETRDIGDFANNYRPDLTRRKPRFRLALYVDPTTLASLLGKLRGSEDEEPDPTALAEIVSLLPGDFEGDPVIDADAVITWPRQKSAGKPILPASEETDETDASSFIGCQVPLSVHIAGVEKRARRYSEGCGLSDDLIADIALAAHLHDVGKCDERFQSWMYGKHFAGSVRLAKSGARRSQSEDSRLRDAAGYPKGARHEAASVMAACALGLLNAAHDRDLVLHLIGAHHGFGRPFFPVWTEPPGARILVESDAVSAETTSGSELARIDSGWVDRYWKLNRVYGYWGLAYLEGILRRADCMQSRWEEDQCLKSN